MDKKKVINVFRKKIYLSLLIALLLLSVVVAILTRTSYAIADVSLGNILENEEQILVQLNEDSHYLSIYFNNELSNFTQLRDQSDIIVKVKVTNERQNYMNALLSGVKVTEIYKGNGIKKGDRIYIYEPSCFNRGVYTGIGGYNIMLENDEYILFLKHLTIPKGYKYKNNEAITFLPVSSYFAKYPLISNEVTQTLVENAEIKYNKIKDFEILTTNKDILALYQSLKNEVLQIKAVSPK